MFRRIDAPIPVTPSQSSVSLSLPSDRGQLADLSVTPETKVSPPSTLFSKITLSSRQEIMVTARVKALWFRMAFNIGETASGFIYMGRQKDMKDIYANKALVKAGRTLSLETCCDVGETPKWSSEMNAAYWAGAICAGQTFLIISSLDEIARRCQHHTRQGKFQGLSGVAPELLWLEDNGYTFSPDAANPSNTWALPPSTRITPVVLDQSYEKFETDGLENRIKRITKIAATVRFLKKETDHAATSTAISRMSR